MIRLFTKTPHELLNTLSLPNTEYTANTIVIYLLLVRDGNRPDAQGNPLKQSTISHAKLCELSGLSKQTVTNALNLLCKDGWIEKKPKLNAVTTYKVFESPVDSARLRKEQDALKQKKEQDKINRQIEKQKRARDKQQRIKEEHWQSTATPDEKRMKERWIQAKQIYNQINHG